VYVAIVHRPVLDKQLALRPDFDPNNQLQSFFIDMRHEHFEHNFLKGTVIHDVLRIGSIMGRSSCAVFLLHPTLLPLCNLTNFYVFERISLGFLRNASALTLVYEALNLDRERCETSR
jgi:hypothetical protein